MAPKVRRGGESPRLFQHWGEVGEFYLNTGRPGLATVYYDSAVVAAATLFPPISKGRGYTYLQRSRSRNGAGAFDRWAFTLADDLRLIGVDGRLRTVRAHPVARVHVAYHRALYDAGRSNAGVRYDQTTSRR